MPRSLASDVIHLMRLNTLFGPFRARMFLFFGSQGVALVVLHKFWLSPSGSVHSLGAGSEGLPAKGNIMEPLQTQPNGLRPRLVMPLPVHVAAQLRHQPDHLLEPRSHLGRRL